MTKRRVVITGMGVVAPNGIGVENFWDSLVHGDQGLEGLFVSLFSLFINSKFN